MPSSVGYVNACGHTEGSLGVMFEELMWRLRKKCFDPDSNGPFALFLGSGKCHSVRTWVSARESCQHHKGQITRDISHAQVILDRVDVYCNTVFGFDTDSRNLRGTLPLP